MDELLKENEEDETAPKVISMRQYLDDFCKEHNIDIHKNQNTRKMPMHIYLNSA